MAPVGTIPLPPQAAVLPFPGNADVGVQEPATQLVLRAPRVLATTRFRARARLQNTPRFAPGILPTYPIPLLGNVPRGRLEA